MVATFTSSDPNYVDTVSNPIAFTIEAAAPTISVSDPGGTFSGNSFPATATAAGIVAGVDDQPGGVLEGVPITLTYYAGTDTRGSPLSGPPIDAGMYTVLASFAGSPSYTAALRDHSFHDR